MGEQTACSGLGLFLMVLLGGCAVDPAPRLEELKDSDYPGVLRPADSLPVEAQWRQVVTAGWPGGERSFEAAVLRQGALLRIVGLSGVGVGFVLELENGQIKFDNRMGREAPFPPRFILLDVQRTFYPWLGDRPAADGIRHGEVGEERIEERWRDGRLVERRFRRIDGKPAGEIVVRYEWARPEWAVPSATVLTNGWFGYTMTVGTTEETRLEGR